jgi:dolichol-phosphate mannosyltransferase
MMDQTVQLSVVVPAFNEEQSIGPLLRDVIRSLKDARLQFEVVIVDDCSTDATAAEVSKVGDPCLRLIRLDRNSGKGAAVQAGIARASGEFIIVQDADLEYSPADIPSLFKAQIVANGRSVFGSRVLGARSLAGWRGILRCWPGQGLGPWGFNFVLSSWLYLVKRVWITDLLTGYKVYHRSIFDNWTPTTNGFETDHEITMHLLNHGLQIVEIPISYVPRTRSEGKKIGPSDAVKAIRTIWRFR